MRLSSRFPLALLALASILPWDPGALAQAPNGPGVSPDTGNSIQGKFATKSTDRDFIRKRIRWFHDQRAFPNQSIPPGIRQAAVQARDSKVALEAEMRGGLSSSSAATGPVEPAWTLIGPRPVSGTDAGRVTSLAIDPVNPKVLYLGGAEGGVWKSIDGGVTWKPLTDSQASLAIGSIALDPSNHNTIYAGTGEENFSGDSYYGAGILKSTDAGLTWTRVAGGFSGGPCGGEWIGAIAVHPSNGKIVLAGVEGCYFGSGGVYRSTDGGTTWTQVLAKNGWDATAIIFDHTNGNLAYAGLYGGGVYKSTDAGKTWNPANGTGSGALPTANVGRMALAMAASNTSILYAAIADTSNSNLLGMYKTVDGGASWTLLTNTPNFCVGQCWYDIVVAVSPVNPNFVVAGGTSNYVGGHTVTTSVDGGMTWVDESAGVHTDSHALAFTPNGSILFIGTDGGVWTTADPGAGQVTWADLNNTLAITEFYPGLSMDQGNVNHTYIGTQDNGTEKYTGSQNWGWVTCGDGGATGIDYLVPSIVYANCIGLSLLKSTDDGAIWSNATTGFVSGDRTAWVPPLVMDPVHHNTLYFGSYRVYQTTNGAGNWSPISGDLSGNATYGILNTIAVAPTDPNTVYTGSNYSKVYVTHNALAATGAVNWTDVTTSSLPNRNVTWIAVDPTSASIAYAGYSGFTGYPDKLGHIFRTTNAGTSWTDISSDLPNTPVDAILVDPDEPSTIFIGTDIGAFYTTNTGGSWSPLGTGLPNVVVTGLGLHENSRTLRASTHGRSAWDLNVTTLLPIPTIDSVSPTTVNANSAAFKLTVSGIQFKNTAVVEWNGTPLATTFVDSSLLTAVVPATDLLQGGKIAVSVINGPGGKLSNPETVTVVNPKPDLTALSKTGVVAGSTGFTLTVTGSNFVTSSKIVWNGTALAVTYGSKTSLSAAIPATYVAKAGTVSVSVMNPAPGGGSSAAFTFTITNPVPTLTSVSPIAAYHGGTAFTLTVTGTNFVSTSSVKWNGIALATTYSSSTKVTALVTAADIQKATTASITVSNPTPGGGTSKTIAFTVK